MIRKCDWCKKEKSVERLFFDSGSQVGMSYCCKECKEGKRKQYLIQTGFDEIGNDEDYANFTGRPQHGVHELNLAMKTIYKFLSFFK